MKRSAILIYSLACLAACTGDGGDPNEGIAIGNPGVMELAIGAAEGLEVTAALLETPELVLVDCEGEATPVPVEEDMLFLGAGVDVPSGDWCQLHAVAAFVFIEAWVEDEPDQVILFELGVDTLILNGPTTDGFTIGEEELLLLEILPPDWTSAAELDPQEEELIVEPSHPMYEGFVALVREEAALFADADGDGVVDDEERDDGLTASTAEPQEPDDDDATPGCSASGGGAGSALLLFVVAATLRRRTSARFAP